MKSNLISKLRLFVSFAILALGLLFIATPSAVACDMHTVYNNSNPTACPGTPFDTWLTSSDKGVYYRLYKSYDNAIWMDVCDVYSIDFYGFYFTPQWPDVGWNYFKVVDDCNDILGTFQIFGYVPNIYTLSNTSVGTCEGVSGTMTLQQSDLDVEYHLFGPWVTASPQPGTGGPIDFNQNSWAVGNYYVYGVDQNYGCYSASSNILSPVSYSLGKPTSSDNPYPQGGGRPRNVTLDWYYDNSTYNNNCGSEYYQVELYEKYFDGQDWTWSQIVDEPTGAATNYQVPFQLLANHDYCWRVFGLNQSGYKTLGLAQSDLFYFTTGAYRIPDIENNGEINENGLLVISNSPNPFGDATNINYSIPEENMVEVSVYSLQGEKLSQLVSERQKPGNYNINFRSNNLSDGIYTLVIKNGMNIATSKLIVVK